MILFGHPEFRAHEQVVFAHDEATGLRAIIAIHDTRLGPAVGGCRMWPYASEEEALTDALRLARGMTYKASLAGLDFGGGKSVVIGDPRRDKNRALLLALGRAVDRLGGRYRIAEDVGTSVADMDVVGEVTRHVACNSEGSGDPSPYTADGVLAGLRAAVQYKFNRNQDDLEGLTVAVQGLGQVGYGLCQRLHRLKARLVVADIASERTARAAQEFGCAVVAPDAIYGATADIFAPCALGGILNDRTIPVLKAKIVAGAANNQLAEDRHGAALRARGILYAPDYATNAGGIIEVALANNGAAAISRRVAAIGETLRQIFARADAEGEPTQRIADRMAEERLQKVTGRAAA